MARTLSIITADDAAALVPDGITICVGGAGAGHAVPDTLLAALGKRFRMMGSPRELTIFHPCGIGDNAERGLNHIAHEGLVKRDIGGFWGNAPKMARLAQENVIEAYNFPQGVLTHLVRAIAGGEPGILTRTGLHTFVDPAYEGGRLNSGTTEELVERMVVDGETYLFYRTFPIDVALIRGTTADCEFNITMEEEVGTFSMLSIAQAARNCGGTVIAQVKRIDESRHASPSAVTVPAPLIDYIVVEPDQGMTFLSDQDRSLVSRLDAAMETHEHLSGVKSVIARRAALELTPGVFVNVGYGMADGVPLVAVESRFDESVTFLIEQGAIGGIPTTGLNFGAMVNPMAIIDDGYQFDFFHGGGLDIAFLGFAQVDREGNVNASRFGNQLTGCGGFIDISQHARKVVFCGTLAAKSDIGITREGIKVNNPGRIRKFIDQVDQITFNGPYAVECGQEIWYVTERAVFELTVDGLVLREIAPGVDLNRDILGMMAFRPIIPDHVSPYPSSVFSGEPLRMDGANMESEVS